MSTSLREGLAPAARREVSDGVFAHVQPDDSWWINNTGLVLGPTGAISIDACATEARTRAYRDAVRRQTPLPVRTLVNTHHHGDHTHGDYLFRDATVVAHERTREALLEAGIWRDPPYWTPFDLGAVELEPPSLTFRDRVTLWAGDLRCEVLHVGGRRTPATTASASSATCTGPTPSRAGPSPARQSTWLLPSATWSPTTAAGRSPAWPESCRARRPR